MDCSNLSLEEKIKIAENNIWEWHEYWKGKVYVAFSGGKDSICLLHLVRLMFPKIPAVYYSIGIEFPEVMKIIKTTNNIQIIKPRISFKKVLQNYGYPIVSKETAFKIREARNTSSSYLRNMRIIGDLGKYNSGIPVKYRYLLEAPFLISEKCCNIFKKEPSFRYVKEIGRQPMIGVKAKDSQQRESSQKRYGCNAFHLRNPQGRPIMSWSDEDAWAYIKWYQLEYPALYDMGWSQTGCVACGFGITNEVSPNRFERMRKTHPKLWNYCIKKLGYAKVLDFMHIPY